MKRFLLSEKLRKTTGAATSGLFVIFLLLHVTTIASPTNADTTPDGGATSMKKGATTTTTRTKWLEECRTRGFDPWHLACTTCEILTAHGIDETIRTSCFDCCQGYKDGERQIRSKPYEAALLVLHRKTYTGELETFLTEDWMNLVETKGAERLKRTKKSTSKNSFSIQQEELEMLLGGGGRYGGTATLYFFEDRKVLDVEDIQKEVVEVKNNKVLNEYAIESIELDGWKRDDIRDMIQTLLR